MQYYTGVGSRHTPQRYLNLFTKWAKVLSDDFILRSGGANGADTAFEIGARHKEIYLPWKGFNGNQSMLFDICDDAITMAREIHPKGKKLDGPALLFHARNCYQVLGKDLNTPSSFLICWTPDGKPKGGTATAIRLAMLYDIEIINLGSL